jgi:CelD/BcsL family acetyltransferase involved in cellulose biosynthesis
VQSTIEPQSKAVFSADNALANIGDAITSGNPSSYRAAQVQFAKAIAGAGDLSQKELRAAGADPSLLGGAADYLSTLATSTPTKDTMEKMRKALETIKRVNTKKATDEITRQRKIAERSGGYDPVALDLALDFPEFQTAPVAPQYATNPQTKERIMSTDGGKTWTPVR